MSSNAVTMRNESFAMVREAVLAWDGGVKLYWEGIPTNAQTNPEPTQDDTWLRASLRHGAQGQGSLAGENGVRRWDRTGFITVQCFAPLKAAGGGVQRATLLACVVRDALQGKKTASGVWFRRPSINEIGEDRDWFNVNATINFEYDELR
jgi:hypothetical protein